MKKILKSIPIFLFLVIVSISVTKAQVNNQLNESLINYSSPKKFIIGGIDVTGTQFLDPSTLISISGLKIGDEITIPGEQITTAIQKLWEQGFLADIEAKATKIEGESIFIEFAIKERPRLSKFTFFGLRKSEQDELKEKIRLIKGKVVTDALVKNTQNRLKKHFAEKGYSNTKVQITPSNDSSVSNTVTLRILVQKGKKVRISEISFIGNDSISDKKLRKKMKNTKEIRWYTLYSKSKFIKSKFEDDKKKVVDFYISKGYRDAEIVSDSIILTDKPNRIKLNIYIEEGKKYYFRNIEWKGNNLYDSKYLSSILNIKKGDLYNMQNLEKRLNYNPSGADISSLYMDDGYLFFQVEPVEVAINGDSIDVELRMNEGPQAIINKIIINGNTKTSDHVILREIRTLPGQKFSRADLIRTQRELSTLGYFDPEQIGMNPKPNMATGMVDIEYNLVEKPSDQFTLSGGYGGFYGFVGTLGFNFNNFSSRNITNFSKWRPLPAGDGQKLSINAQANGPSFQSYNFSFTEPWLGGKKPNSFTVSFNHSISRLGMFGGLGANSRGFGVQAPTNAGRLKISGITLSLGRRLKIPDDYFVLSHSLSYNLYDLNKYNFFTAFDNGTGISNNITFTNTLSRNSIDNPTFPRNGSSFTLTSSLTPPYSLFRKSNDNLPKQIQYKFVEYHKWMIDMSNFIELPGKFVLHTRGHFGFLGRYNSKLLSSPFERFLLGGNGLSGFNFLLGSDIIGLRGYANNSIGPNQNSGGGGIAYDKFVMELRYPVSLNPMATIFVHGFAEGGNNFASFKDYDPFNLYKTVGVGAKIFMPAFGMIGLDYGFALDKNKPGAILQPFTFTIGQQIR